MTLRRSFFALLLAFTTEVPALALDTAYFAGGAFWSLEEAFEKRPGVRAVVPGYMGGTDSAPSYGKVIEGGTGHFLAVEVAYDPKQVTYAKLADFFWRQIDPLTQDRQFSDSGRAFHTALLYRDSAQQRDAEASLRRLQRGGRFKRPVMAAVEPAGKFFPAEADQQDYHKKSPGRYRAWLRFSGRQAALDSIWGTGSKVKAMPAQPGAKDPKGPQAPAP